MNKREENGRKSGERRQRAHKTVIGIFANKKFMDGVYQGLEDERLGKGVRSKDLKRTRAGH